MAVEPIAIEGGEAGGGSVRQAAERRTIAARLSREADWLESVATDQRTAAELLSTLPGEFSLLHDLQWADASAADAAPHALDHLVVGPGGVFAVVTRRFVVPVTERDGQLWVGEAALADELAAVIAAAQSLANALGTAVAPVMGFHGDSLPADAPGAVQGVLLCAAADLAAEVQRFPHTMLLPHECSAVVEHLQPLLVTPGTRSRAQRLAALTVDGAPEPRSVDPGPSTATPDPAPSSPSAGRPQRTADDAPTRQRHWPAVVAVVVLVVGVIGGGLVWFLGGSDEPSSGGVATTAAPEVGELVGELADDVAPPVFSASTVCPETGAGWQIVPDWPGNVEQLSSYDVEVQDTDGTWTHLMVLESPDLVVAALSGQPPSVTFTFRVSAVMLDMSRSVGEGTEVTTPAEPC